MDRIHVYKGENPYKRQSMYDKLRPICCHHESEFEGIIWQALLATRFLAEFHKDKNKALEMLENFLSEYYLELGQAFQATCDTVMKTQNFNLFSTYTTDISETVNILVEQLVSVGIISRLDPKMNMSSVLLDPIRDLITYSGHMANAMHAVIQKSAETPGDKVLRELMKTMDGILIKCARAYFSVKMGRCIEPEFDSLLTAGTNITTQEARKFRSAIFMDIAELTPDLTQNSRNLIKRVSVLSGQELVDALMPSVSGGLLIAKYFLLDPLIRNMADARNGFYKEPGWDESFFKFYSNKLAEANAPPPSYTELDESAE